MICNRLYNVLKMVYCLRTEKKSLTTYAYTQKNTQMYASWKFQCMQAFFQ